MRRTAVVLAGSAALSVAFTLQAAAAPAEIIAPNARAAAEVDFHGELQRQKNVIDSFESTHRGVYCVIVDPAAGIDLSSALILANGGVGTTSVEAAGRPTSSCDNRRDAITVVPVNDGHPTPASFTIAVL
ncbi:hypothetical protein [Streptomyces sp. NRRL S-350]|uniref:hypothetical protein n=1 Tax=Streptomyces sp. NRRL S-350 TaxID=1463902 RepID=UPI0004BEBBF1|nr:hypothetical protein [Streptomyces sp. NRRL S-350]